MRAFLSSFFMLCIALLLSLAIGSVAISPSELWSALRGHGTELVQTILWNIRLPRTVLIALVGAALGGSGAAYQCPMACGQAPAHRGDDGQRDAG